MSEIKSIQTEPISEESFEKPFDLQEIIYVLLENAWVIGICLVVGLFAGLVYIGQSKSNYVSRCVIQIDPEGRKYVSFQDENPAEATNQEILQTALESFSTRTLLQRVIEVEKLNTDPLFLPPKSNGQPYTVEQAMGALGGMFTVGIRKGTRLIDVTAKHPKAEMAQKLANSLAREFIRQTIEQRASTSQIALGFLVEEANRLKAKLQQSEQAMQDYKKEHNSVSLVEKQDIVVTKLQSLNTQLTAAKAERLKLATDYEEVKRRVKGLSGKETSLAAQASSLLEIPSVTNMPSIAELKKEIEAAEVNVATLGLRYRERHPKMIQAQSQLMESKAALVSNVLKVPPQIRATYETALANESRLEAALKEQEQLALELNQQAIPYNVLARDVETDRAVYESTLKRLKEVDIAKGIESGNYRIFEAARLPLSPVGAKKLRVIALSLLGGLLVGVALSIGLYMMDTSFRSVEQAEALTGLPVVGAIPYWSRSEQSKNALALVDEPDSNVAEAFRSLRTMLAVSENGQGDKALLFTSALKEEGKSFCAVNYAIGLAQQQLRTIIVDADLRRPKVAEMLCRKDPGVGLADHLAGKAKLEKVIYPTLVEGLSVLPAGSALPNPAELLSGGGFSRLLKELSKSFDRIIIDTAPLNLVGDALLVVQHCKSVCLVMRAGKTPRKSVRRACEMLSRAGLTNLSLVLNQLYASPGLAKYYRYDSGAPIYGASYARRDSAKV